MSSSVGTPPSDEDDDADAAAAAGPDALELTAAEADEEEDGPNPPPAPPPAGSLPSRLLEAASFLTLVSSSSSMAWSMLYADVRSLMCT